MVIWLVGEGKVHAKSCLLYGENRFALEGKPMTGSLKLGDNLLTSWNFLLSDVILQFV